jgi:hypothetical protein
MFRDKEGKISSKRIMGTIVIGVVLVISVVGTINSLSETADIIWPLSALGGSLLGISVAERRK